MDEYLLSLRKWFHERGNSYDGDWQLSGAGVAAGAAQFDESARRGDGGDEGPGTGGDRCDCRRRVVAVRRQSSRNKRDDRLFRQTHGGNCRVVIAAGTRG